MKKFAKNTKIGARYPHFHKFFKKALDKSNIMEYNEHVNNYSYVFRRLYHGT